MLDGKLVAEELKALRIRKNKTVDEVCEALNIHVNTLYKYEKDASNLQLELLEKILDYYEINELIFFKVIREYNHMDEEII